jgi:hypothetical protein
MKYTLPNPVFEELAKAGRIKMTVGKQGRFDSSNRAIGLQRRLRAGGSSGNGPGPNTDT